MKNLLCKLKTASRNEFFLQNQYCFYFLINYDHSYNPLNPISLKFLISIVDRFLLFVLANSKFQIHWISCIYLKGEDFLVKMGGSPYKGGCLKKGSKNCFSLIKYGFCSSNALYSESLSFRMFIFILTPFHTWDCYYFVLHLRLVLLIKLFFITLVFSLLKMK